MRVTLASLRYKALTEPALHKLAESKWKIGEQLLWKRFAMPSHTAAAEFAYRVAQQADLLQHHPEINIKYRFVTFELRTNDIGGLTEHDEKLAYIIDSLKVPNDQ